MDNMVTAQTWKIGDCQELMGELEPESVDLIVTDPPYGYSFMGLDWDKVVPSVDLWKECLRILKPGAFAFVMSSPRQDVLAHNIVNLSDAGFNTGFTSIYWTFASGFPKAGNIGKMVDKRLGAEREVVGRRTDGRYKYGFTKEAKYPLGAIVADRCGGFVSDKAVVTAPATSQAQLLDGSYAGFQPKPAVEVVMVVMKPLSEKTYIDQAMTNQKGITWLDDGRIPYQSDADKGNINRFKGVPMLPPEKGFNQNKVIIDSEVGQNGGRFPANLLVSDDALNDGKRTNSSDSIRHSNHEAYGNADNHIYGKYGNSDAAGYSDSGSFSRYFDLDAWWDTQLNSLPKEAQKTFPFLITPKASKSEKGCDCMHPTVKPVKLFSWLITIGSREGDKVCDPFIGSGTALTAGRLTNRNVIGFEISDEYEHLYAERSMKHTPPLTAYFGGAQS